MAPPLRRFLLAFWLAGLVGGCGRGSAHSPEAVERGRQAVEAALESWQKGEPADRLKALPEPVEFADDARAGGQRLQAFRLVRTDATDPAALRYTAVLTLRDRRGRTTEQEATYGVTLTTPIRVARDPYF
jgi:hypothetical protein